MLEPLTIPEIRMVFKTFVGIQEKRRQVGGPHVKLRMEVFDSFGI